MISDKELLNEFFIEANELLDSAEEALLSSEKSKTKSSYDLIFRVFHSLKGTSSTLGFFDLEKHLHHLEDHLQEAKNDPSQFIASVDYYLNGVDITRKMLQGESGTSTLQEAPDLAILEKAKEERMKELQSRSRKVLLVSEKKNCPMSKKILALEDTLHFEFIQTCTEGFKKNTYSKDDHVVLISALKIDQLKHLIPIKNTDFPIVLLTEEEHPHLVDHNIHQILNISDELFRVHLTIESAFEAKLNKMIFEKSRTLMMYMYADLEGYLVDDNKTKMQQDLRKEIQSFIKDYKSKKRIPKAA